MGHVISNSKNRFTSVPENPKIIILDFLRGFFLRYKKKILNAKEFYRNHFVLLCSSIFIAFLSLIIFLS